MNKIYSRTIRYTQQVVATETGIPCSNIPKYGKITIEPSLENLCIIAQFYNVSINWLLGVSIEPSYQKEGFVYVNKTFLIDPKP